MPVIGAVLFEFTLRELRQRAAGRADRQMAAVRWLHPAERIRVQRLLAADERISAQAATRRVRTEQAARRLHQLRRALHARDRAARPGALAARRARIAERRAHAALTRAGFGDPAIAADVLRQVQVLTRTAHLALLDYTTPDAARDIIASLITAGPAWPGVAGPAARRSRRHIQEPPFPGCCPGRCQPARPAAARTRRHTSAGNSACGQRARGCRPRRSPRRRDRRSRCGHPGRSPPARRAAQPENARRQAPPRRLPRRQPQPARAAGRSLRPDRSKLTARPRQDTRRAGRLRAPCQRQRHGPRLPAARTRARVRCRRAAGRPAMTPRPAAPALAREDEHRRKLAVLRARLHEDALALRTPGEWAARLRLAALMPGEDFANILLISSQRPGATLVRDYRQWTATGRQVRRHESGIETFRIPPRPAPRRPQDRGKRDDDEPPPTWRDADRVAYVWDLSQTSGQPVAPPGLPAPGQAPAGLWDALCWLARREGFAVEREDGAPADGTTFWTARRIRLLPGLTGEQAVWALAHQLGHVMLHAAPGPHPPGTTTSGCMGLRKAEADSVAYITCARHGVTVSGELACPASWAGSDPRSQPAAAVLTAGHRIATAATRVIRYADRVLHGDDSAACPCSPSAACHPGRRACPDPAGRGVQPPGRHLCRASRRTPAAGRAGPAHPGRPSRRRGLLHQPARRQLGARLPGQPGRQRRHRAGLGHRIRPGRVERADRPPARPRPRRP